MNTTGSTISDEDDEDLTVLLQQANQIKQRERNASMKQYVQAAEQARMEDKEAFDHFLDSASLGEQALERLVDEEAGGAGEALILQSMNLMDQAQLSAAKRHAMMAMVGQKQQQQKQHQQHQASRGRRPQRSYSAAVGGLLHGQPRHRQHGKSRRAHSTGGRRRPRSSSRLQSTLRDDLMCGMEKNCAPCTPGGEEGVLQEGEMDDGCFCGPPDDHDTDTQRHHDPSQQHTNHQEQHHRHIYHRAHKGGPPHSPNNNHRSHHKVKGILKHSKHAPSEQSFTASTAVTLEEDDKFDILSPTSEEYMYLRTRDPAFQHAMNAGSLWQSLVGQSVRFPKEWWQGGHRTAPLGCNRRIGAINKWVYYDRHRIKGNTFLNKHVKRRDEPGQILLHLVVRDFMTSNPIMDVVIGCFHPNAKSVRTTEQANKRNKDCRDVWLATRFRTEDSISVIDPGFLQERLGQPLKTPLGDTKHRISNANVRTVYGESPPIRTVFVLESDIYETLASIDASQNGPADVLLGKYVFRY